MKSKKLKSIKTPYRGISKEDYTLEKNRLQLELLRIQQKVIKKQRRLAIVLEGRDASGKGSTIKRLTEYLMPLYFRVISLGIPTKKESRNWFLRYKKHFPKEGEIVFFDRSWYTRALIEPTMGYCTKAQYKYFVNKVLDWEEKHIDEGLILVKLYFSIDQETQLFHFERRLKNPLTYWKFTENDLKAQKKWSIFTNYKEQMFAYTSSKKSPWVTIGFNSRREGRLTVMLHLVRLLGNKDFVPLLREDVAHTNSITFSGVKFKGLNHRQLAVLQEVQKLKKEFKK